MSRPRGADKSPGSPPGSVDWPHIVERASQAISSKLRASGEVTPSELFETVAGSLPPSIARWLTRRLTSLGWLSLEARLPFDILDSPACPRDMRDGRRELVRLALFGVAGEGARSDAKRREAVYQQLCAGIMRETRDLESLSYAAARALGHPEVHADPVLHGMLRSFIAEREAELRTRAHLPASEDDAGEEEVLAKPAEFKLPLRQRVQASLSKLRLELEGHLTHYNEPGAAEVLERICDLRHRYPGHVEPAVVRGCQEQLERMVEQRDLFRRQLGELVRQSVESIQEGDQKIAAWVLRRLNVIHAMLPAVLPQERLEALRRTILQTGEKQERREAARALATRERAVAGEIERLGTAIHSFHRLVEKGGDQTVAREAEEAYRHAVEEVRCHDDEWLADLMIELDCLLDDLREPRSRAEAQVDNFVSNVRTAVRRMREEIRLIQKKRAGSMHE